jgi:hypothetical protein
MPLTPLLVNARRLDVIVAVDGSIDDQDLWPKYVLGHENKTLADVDVFEKRHITPVYLSTNPDQSQVQPPRVSTNTRLSPSIHLHRAQHEASFFWLFPHPQSSRISPHNKPSQLPSNKWR